MAHPRKQSCRFPLATAHVGRLHGLRPIGSEALNIARLEAGFIITGMDFTPADICLREDRLRSPLEMGLGWLIDWDKGHFTGKAALQRQRDRGTTWSFVGLEIDGNIPAEGAILYHAQKHEVGVITGACWSPVLKKNIALAQVAAQFDMSVRNLNRRFKAATDKSPLQFLQDI